MINEAKARKALFKKSRKSQMFQGNTNQKIPFVKVLSGTVYTKR